MNSRRAWLVFGFAVLAYLVAVVQRSSLGVAGIDATERFAVDATTLSALAVTQLVVYAGLQIPVGVALDRVGPRRLLITGALLMVAGQLAVAFAPSISLAIVGRVLVGAGDAMTFISVLRVLSAWFSGRALPLVSQWTGTVGQAGQLLSAVPFSLVLHRLGWTPAFGMLAGLSVLSLAGILIGVADRAPGTPPLPPPGPWRQSLGQLGESLARPGTRLGLWAHYVTMASGTMLALLWGFPFLSVALGYGPQLASTLLGLLVIAAMVTGPVLGLLTARFPWRRSNMVLGIVGAGAVAWTAVILWPGQPPLWLIVVLLVAVAAGGPGSLIGFDFARTFNPARSLGSANGVVNVGGFVASFVLMLLVGAVLDLVAGGSSDPERLYTLEGFRLAFLVQYPVIGFGVVMLLIARRRTRHRLRHEEGIEVAPLWVALARAWRRWRG